MKDELPSTTPTKGHPRLQSLAGWASVSLEKRSSLHGDGGARMAHRLRFGIFLAPFHKPGINPTLALQSDLELIQWLDRCGYDEAWFGEHHSAGTEISASPEILMAVAAERTRHIKLGSGVVSLSYHNPLWVAERIVLLDHLTRGRVMLGVGPRLSGRSFA
jgi:hypothetical protein